MSASPAEMLRAAIVARGFGVMPWGGPSYVVDVNGDYVVAPDGTPVVVFPDPVIPNPALYTKYPVFVGSMPDSPDNAVCVYDTEGFKDGRDMRNKQSIIHPGYQVRVRGLDHPTGYAKIRDIQRLLDTLGSFVVVIDGTRYTIAAITQVSGILSLGEEPEAKRRNGFTFNGTITFREEP